MPEHPTLHGLLPNQLGMVLDASSRNDGVHEVHQAVAPARLVQDSAPVEVFPDGNHVRV